jgi:hypothetical protein
LNPDGRIDIVWTDTSSGQFTLDWVEIGCPEPTYARRIPDHASAIGARQFRGTVDHDFEQSGLRCRLSLSLPNCSTREIRQSVDLAPALTKLAERAAGCCKHGDTPGAAARLKMMICRTDF